MKGIPTKIKNYNKIIVSIVKARGVPARRKVIQSRVDVLVSHLHLLSGYVCRCNAISITELEYLVIKEKNPDWILQCTTCNAIEMLVELYRDNAVDRERVRTLLNYYVPADKIIFSGCSCDNAHEELCTTCIRVKMLSAVADMEERYIVLPENWYFMRSLDLRSFIKK